MRTIAIWLVRMYQMLLSPLLPFNQCRYIPTCSQYMIEALSKYGALKGGWMGLKRIGRCHPYSKRDWYDPVP